MADIPDRPTREQVDAALEAEPCPADREDWAVLAAEVRALRAEANCGAGHDPARICCAHAAELAARTPQPAELEPNRAHLEMTGTAAVLTVWRTHDPGSTPHVAHRIDVDPRCLTLSWANDAWPRATVEHVPDCRCGDLTARLTVASTAPLPAVPDGEDAAACSCCNGDPLTVCAACEQHSCWAGRFMCESSRTAGTKQASPVQDGEDVPARLDAAAEALAGMDWTGASEQLRHIVFLLSREDATEVRAAVAAALSRIPNLTEKD